MAGLDGLAHRLAPRDHRDRNVGEYAVGILLLPHDPRARGQRLARVLQVGRPEEAAGHERPADEQEREERKRGRLPPSKRANEPMDDPERGAGRTRVDGDEPEGSRNCAQAISLRWRATLCWRLPAAPGPCRAPRGLPGT